MSRRQVLTGLFGALMCLVTNVQSQEYASPERKETAMGHYSRARSLLVEAVKEFEMGRRVARPDLLIDPEEWRISVISRTEELNRILDPKPRITRQGVRFNAEKLLIQPEKQRRNLSPSMSPRDSNQYGELQRQNELKAAELMEQIRRQELGNTSSGVPATLAEPRSVAPLEKAPVAVPPATKFKEVTPLAVEKPVVSQIPRTPPAPEPAISPVDTPEEAAPQVEIDLDELDIYMDAEGEEQSAVEDDEASLEKSKEVEVKVGDAIDSSISGGEETEVTVETEDGKSAVSEEKVEVNTGEENDVVEVKDDAGMFDDFFKD